MSKKKYHYDNHGGPVFRQWKCKTEVPDWNREERI